MRYDIVGGMLLWISAFLYAARYMAAALFMGPGLKNWDVRLFQAAYRYVGNGLTTWAMLALIAGLGVIVAGCVVNSRKQKTEPNQPDAGDA